MAQRKLWITFNSGYHRGDLRELAPQKLHLRSPCHDDRSIETFAR